MLYKLNDLELVKIISRPSKVCKTPYVADIELSGVPAPIFVDGLDALEVKKIIGMASLCVSSRFHGCVSSLSQGVPTLGTSWGHKYEQLFAQYGCADNILSIDDLSLLESKLQNIEQFNEQARQQLADAAREQKNQTQKMWATVFEEVRGV